MMDDEVTGLKDGDVAHTPHNQTSANQQLKIEESEYSRNILQKGFFETHVEYLHKTI